MLRRIFSYMKEYKKYAWLALICIGVEVVLEIMVPKLMADLIDIGVTNSDVPYIINKGIQMAVCAVAALILGVGSARFSALAGQGMGANIRKAEYEKLQSYSFSNIDHFSVSSLVTRLTSDVTNIQNAVSTGMRPFGRSPVMLIFATTLAFQINSTLALVFLVALPVLAVMLIIIIINVGPRYGRMQGAVDLVNRCIEENLTAVRVVKSYVRGDYEIEKFGHVNDNLKNESEKAFGIAVLNMPAMQFVMYSTILGILLIGGRLINSGQMMIGQLTSFLSYVLLILNSLMMMSNVFLLMTRSLASAERIMKVIDEPIDITDENAKNIEVKKGEIEFNHVWFKYKDTAKEYVLSDVSFHINAGQTVGIIGQTGSSKTTLIQLIPRLYDATEGSITLDGENIKNISMKELRDELGYVPQKGILFSGTIESNIKFGAPEASMDIVKEAAEIAQATEFIETKSAKYESPIAQGGTNVSGGQKQRLSIARAIAKNPKIFIFDDSFSALDLKTDAALRKALASKVTDSTVIIVAQRISTILHADQILVMDEGKIVGKGTHEELLKNCEVYQQIAKSQMSAKELGIDGKEEA